MVEIVIFLMLLVVAGGITVAALLPLWPFLLYRAALETRWLARWRQLVRQGGRPAAGAVATVTGTAAAAEHEEPLRSPAGGVPCVAYWLDARGGALGLARHREKEARAFVVRTAEGDVAVDPSGAYLLPVPSSVAAAPQPLARVAPPLDERLKERHLSWSPAAPLYLVEERIQEGEACTVVGLTQRAPSGDSPYRRRSTPVIGGKGPLLLAAMSRADLERELGERVLATAARTAFFAGMTAFSSAVVAFVALAAPEVVLCGTCSWAAGFVILGRFAGPAVAPRTSPFWPALPSR